MRTVVGFQPSQSARPPQTPAMTESRRERCRAIVFSSTPCYVGFAAAVLPLPGPYARTALSRSGASTASSRHDGSMAKIERRLPQNAPGEFYVDSSCIDCETCMIVAPETFDESATDQAFVHRQPEGPEEERRAYMALVS